MTKYDWQAFFAAYKKLDLQHNTKLRWNYFHCLVLQPSSFTWEEPKFFNCSLSRWNLLATLLCVCELKKIWIIIGRWMRRLWILGLLSKRHSEQKKMMTEQHVQRKKVVARPLTYTFMAQPLGKLESSFHYMKETNNKSVEASWRS